MLTEPGMFRRYIAASCTWPGAGEYLVLCAQQYAAQYVQVPADLYLAIGGLEEEQLAGFRRLVGLLQRWSYPGLRVLSEILDGEGHGLGVLAKSLVNGLRAVLGRQARSW